MTSITQAVSSLFWTTIRAVAGRTINTLDDLRVSSWNSWAERCERLGEQVVALNREIDILMHERESERISREILERSLRGAREYAHSADLGIQRLQAEVACLRVAVADRERERDEAQVNARDHHIIGGCTTCMACESERDFAIVGNVAAGKAHEFLMGKAREERDALAAELAQMRTEWVPRDAIVAALDESEAPSAPTLAGRVRLLAAARDELGMQLARVQGQSIQTMCRACEYHRATDAVAVGVCEHPAVIERKMLVSSTGEPPPDCPRPDVQSQRRGAP